MIASHAVYGLIAWGIVVLLRRSEVLPRARILLGFLVAGLVAGLVAMLAWPADVAVLLNLPGVLLGTWSTAGRSGSSETRLLPRRITPYRGCFGCPRCTCLSQF